jgi:hypothetical protein
MEDERYLAAHVAAYPADRGNILVFNQNTGRPELLSDQLFGILRRADRFDSLAGHVRRIFASGWEDDGSGFVESAFRELVARGLLISESAFRASLLKDGGQEAPPPVSSIGVPTRDRVPQLQRCLGSWIQNNEKYDRHPSYIILDGSRDENQLKIQEMLAPFAAKGARIFYAGKKEKARFIKELVRTAEGDGLPEEAVAFALLGDEAFMHSSGVNRNACLLATPGELSLMTDDDIVCQPVMPGEPAPALCLSSLIDPLVNHFHADRKQLTESVRTAEVDVLSCHEKLLGRTICGCLSALGPDSALDIKGVAPESAHFFARASNVVKATTAGSWGDSGMDSPHMFLELNNESRDLLLRSEHLYGRAKVSREVLRQVSGYTISVVARFAGMNIGIDNRSLLPPFLPVGRNEDGTFAMNLHLCVEDALVGHVPVAVLHSPSDPHRYEPGPIPNPAPRFAEIISTIASSFRPSPGRLSVSEKLSALAKLYVDIGSMNLADFRGHIETLWVSESSRYINFLEYLLDLHHGQPDYWAEDVQSFIERLTDFTVHQSAAIPRELPESHSPEQAIEISRRVVRKFGQLLQWWPVIYGAAGALRAAGIGLARPI